MYLEKIRLDGRRAVVTGAARGIGLAIAEALAEAGAHVVLTDRSEGGAATAAEGLRAQGRSASHASLDVADRAAVDRVAAPQLAGRHPHQ